MRGARRSFVHRHWHSHFVFRHAWTTETAHTDADACACCQPLLPQLRHICHVLIVIAFLGVSTGTGNLLFWGDGAWGLPARWQCSFIQTDRYSGRWLQMRWTFRCRFLLSSNIPPRTASQPTPSARAPLASGASSLGNEADSTVVGADAPLEDALALTQELEAALAARGTPDAAQPATVFVAGELVANMAKAAESPRDGLAREGGAVGAGLEARTLVLDVMSHYVVNQVLGICTRVMCRNCRLSSAAMFRACACFTCCVVLLSTRVAQERFGGSVGLVGFMCNCLR